MSQSVSQGVVKRLRKRYLLALSIIACLIVGSQILIQLSIGNQLDDSRVINLAGRQRMLSQKITKTILGIDRLESQEDKALLLLELDKAIALWQTSHDGLIHGDAALNLPGHNSERISNMFEGVSVQYHAMLESAQLFSQLMKAATVDQALVDQQIEIILQNEPAFLKGMDDIVFQYDYEARGKISRIASMEWVLMLCAIVTLMIEVRYIFMPAEQHIQSALNELVDSEDNIRKLFDIAPSAMFLVDATDYSIVRLNVMACEVIGVPFNKAIDRRFYDFISGDYLDVLQKTNQERFNGEVKQIEVKLRNESGEAFVMLMSVTRMTFHERSIFLVGLSDITDRKKHEETLKELATIDDMTGLLNRRTGLLMLSKEMEKAHREIYDLSACFIDLDGLKKINDDYGHSEGDWFIRRIGEVLLHNVRLGDVVFRYGGDEMILVLSNCNEDEAEIIMKRVELDIQMVNKRKEKPYAIGLSYGIADYNKLSPDSLDVFLAIADERMYVHKQSKKVKRTN